MKLPKAQEKTKKSTLELDRFENTNISYLDVRRAESKDIFDVYKFEWTARWPANESYAMAMSVDKEKIQLGWLD